MNGPDAFGLADGADRLFHVSDRELARFAIDIVAHEDAFSAGGPGQDDANEIMAEIVTEVPHGSCGVVEGVVVAMDEDHDLLALRRCEAPMDLALKLGNRALVGGDDVGSAANTFWRRLRRIGSLR